MVAFDGLNSKDVVQFTGGNYSSFRLRSIAEIGSLCANRWKVSQLEPIENEAPVSKIRDKSIKYVEKLPEIVFDS